MGSNATAKETETELIRRAQQALSQCNWEVGECAAIWTRRFARGRTDADFAVLVGLSPDQVYQRRRVWETFSDVRDNYPGLKWSHFYAALTWDDAAECLQWAQEIQATVAEMKAWRRAQRGEDLSQHSADEPDSLPLGEMVVVKAPGGETVSAEARQSEPARSSSGQEFPTLSGVARQSDDGTEYAPFYDGAVTPPQGPPSRERESPTPEQVIKRITATMERCEALLTAEVCKAFAKLPEKVRQRFLRAARELEKRVHDLA
jgi:hypothetical protein